MIFLSLSALLGLLKAGPTAPKSLETVGCVPGFGEGAGFVETSRNDPSNECSDFGGAELSPGL